MTRPDLFLASSVSAMLESELRARFTVHRDPPPPSTRAIVGGGTTLVDVALLDRLPALEIVAIHGVGHDRIDLAAAAARGVQVTTTPDVLTDDVADLALGLMLAVQRRVAANDGAIRAGKWSAPLGRRASGRHIGIFGLGRIGTAIAHRAVPFAAGIHYVARTPKAHPDWTFNADISALAEACDILVLAAPGGDATRAIVDASVLRALGSDGVLINVARGSLVDEPALIDALETGIVAGAGLDVFADEPHVPEALKRLDQVVLAPHQGSATEEGRAAMANLVLANLDAHFAGRALPTPLRD